MDANPHLCVW
jgi:Kinesin motor domain